VKHDGHEGRRCILCDIFTVENDVKPDKLMERLIAIKGDDLKQNIPVCEFCEQKKNDLRFCTNCRMNICSTCQRVHKKAPDTKHHHLDSYENGDSRKGIIDEVHYCSKHNDRAMECYCETCNQLVCSSCQIEHCKHSLKTTDLALQEIVNKMKDYMKNITTKLITSEKQLESIDKEIESIKKTYSKWKEESDRKLEILTNRMKAHKAEINDKVYEEQLQNIKRLEEIKHSVIGKVERFKVVLNLIQVTNTRTKNQSQLVELHSGLLEQGNQLTLEEIHVEQFQQIMPFF
jgi:gas vesicle protein